MKTLKQVSMLVLLCLFGVVQVRAQLSWARSFDVSATIPGASWTDIAKVIRVSQDRYVVAGTLTGTGTQSYVVARFSQDGYPGWVREMRGAPGSQLIVNDIAESRDAANPGYVVCGEYRLSGVSYNYLARLDDMGNILWDRYWQNNAKLVAVIFSRTGQIVTTGEGYTAQTVRSVTAYRFTNAGASLAARIISTDPQMYPVDLLEDLNGTGFFVLANFRYTSASNWMPYVINLNNTLNVVANNLLNYPTTAPAPPFYQNVESVCFEQDLTNRDLIILANARGTGRSLRPSVIRFTPVINGAVTTVVLAPPMIPTTQMLQGTDLVLINGDPGKGIMVTTMHNAGSTRTYTWRLDNLLNTTDYYEQWLAVPNIRNTSLCVAKGGSHYVLAGHDASSHLTLNVVNLNGDKVDLAGNSTCTGRFNWTDERPKVTPSMVNYSAVNVTVNPNVLNMSNQYAWNYDNACNCAQVEDRQLYRYAYPQIPYNTWELEINRAKIGNTGNIYLANSLVTTSPEKMYLVELSPSGQDLQTFAGWGPFAKEGRQFMQAANRDLLALSRVNLGGNPVTSLSRFGPGGGGAFWAATVPNSQTPARMYMAESPNASQDIIIAGDIEGLDEHAVTNNLMIGRFSSGGALIYYQEIPVLYNGAPRDNFRVHALEATRDGGFAICGSSGVQNDDFISGFVMKFSAAGTLMWQYDFRRQTPNNCYDLHGPHECRSASVFFDLRHNGPNGYYLAGYTSDQNPNGHDASFWNGIVVHLDNFGNELAVQEFRDGGGGFTTFKGIAVDQTDIAVVGQVADPGMTVRNDLFVRIDKASLNMVAAQTYSHDGNSTLLDVFNMGNGTGYTMAGSTTDWYGVNTPQVIRTDINGSNGCEKSIDMEMMTPVNDPVTFNLDKPVDFQPGGIPEEIHRTCVEVFDICQQLAPAAIRQMPTGLESFGSRKDKTSSEVSVYPNPATTVLNLEVPKDVKVREISIVDINGREVYHNRAAMGNHAEIDISALPEGMYAVRMETSTGQRFTRFIKL